MSQLPPRIKLTAKAPEEITGTVHWENFDFPESYREYFAEITVPAGESRYLPQLESNYNIDIPVYISGDIGDSAHISGQHHPLYVEGCVGKNAKVKLRQSIFSAARLEEGATIEGGELVILGATQHYRPQEQSVTQKILTDTPIFVVPESRRQQILARLCGMVPDKPSLQKLKEIGKKNQQEYLSGSNYSGLNSLNRIIRRLQMDGDLIAVFPNGCQEADNSLIPTAPPR